MSMGIISSPGKQSSSPPLPEQVLALPRLVNALKKVQLSLFLTSMKGALQMLPKDWKAATGQKPDKALCNVTVQEDVDALFAAAQKSLGSIDIVINNAGLGGTADIVDMTDDQWSIVLDVTLNGCFRINRACLANYERTATRRHRE
jgi:NAD(P)-dependent dehydrogenase (short-subunit alcohol dehydrogenase family)